MLKLEILLLFWLSSVISLYSQSFIVTDIQFTGDCSYLVDSKSKIEAETLGSTVVTEFFDTKVKVTIRTEKKNKVFVLNRKGDDLFIFIETRPSGDFSSITLKINKTLSYIDSATLTNTTVTNSTSKCTGVMTLKR